jgi:hypothetical protein
MSQEEQHHYYYGKWIKTYVKSRGSSSDPSALEDTPEKAPQQKLLRTPRPLSPANTSPIMTNREKENILFATGLLGKTATKKRPINKSKTPVKKFGEREPVSNKKKKSESKKPTAVHPKRKRTSTSPASVVSIKLGGRGTPPMRFTPMAPRRGEQISLSDDDDLIPEGHRYT